LGIEKHCVSKHLVFCLVTGYSASGIGGRSLNISRHIKDGAQSHNDVSCAIVQPFFLTI